MATAAHTQRRKALIEGRTMTCPRCKGRHDVLRYVPLKQIEEFVHETNPIVKCPTCRWIFSPGPHIMELFE